MHDRVDIRIAGHRSLRAAGAAYRLRAGGSPADRDLLLELAPSLPHAGYRSYLIDLARGAD